MEKELEELKIHKKGLETLFKILWKEYTLLNPPNIPVQDEDRNFPALFRIVCAQLRFIRRQYNELLKKQ